MWHIFTYSSYGLKFKQLILKCTLVFFFLFLFMFHSLQFVKTVLIIIVITRSQDSQKYDLQEKKYSPVSNHCQGCGWAEGRVHPVSLRLSLPPRVSPSLGYCLFIV